MAGKRETAGVVLYFRNEYQLATVLSFAGAHPCLIPIHFAPFAALSKRGSTGGGTLIGVNAKKCPFSGEKRGLCLACDVVCRWMRGTLSEGAVIDVYMS